MKHIFIMFALAFIIACNPKNENLNEEGAHGHGTETDGLPSLSYTVYTEQTELFAEFSSIVLGDSMKLGGHFTQLGEYFKAITDGTITMTLSVGEKSVSQTSTVSSSPGIFRFAVVPNNPGMGKIVFDIKNKDYTDQIIIDSVIVYSDEKSALASKKDEPKNNDISYLKEQAWKVEFATMQINKKMFSEIIKTTGEILPAQGDEMAIVANANGIITFVGNKAVVGTSVKSGEMLFTISGGNLIDGNNDTRYKQTKITYDKAKADFERNQVLIKDNIISQKDFLESKARFETEQANYNNLTRNYQSGGHKVTAPISGFVKNILVAEGQYVSVGQAIASISQNKSLVLKAEVSQKYFPKLPFIATANFMTSYDNKMYSIEALNGQLISYGKSNDANTLYIPVTFNFDNRGEVVPGSLVEVYLKLKTYTDALVIPVSALIEEQGVFFAFVQTAGESFSKRELTLGGSDGFNVQVLSGIKEGERVVTKGAYQIKLATASGTIPAHGHAH